MEKLKLGKSDLKVSPLMFGGNEFGWTAEEKTSFALLDKFVDQGFNFIDTADVYSNWVPGHIGGESETIIGKWLKRTGKRDQVVIATKVGLEMAPDKKGLSKRYIPEAIDASLKRLQTDYIDLYQPHSDDPETPLEETLEVFTELIKQGKVRIIGASNYSAPRLEEALEKSRKNNLASFQSLQPLYNLCERKEYEQDLEPVCVQHGLAVISYYALAAGFLTGKYRSQEDVEGSARKIRVQRYLDPRGMRILKALDKVSAELHSTPAKVALSWVMNRPSITAPITSATTLSQLDELIDATKLELNGEAIELLEEASAYT